MKKCLIYFEPGYERFAVGLLDIAEKMYGTAFKAAALCINSETTAALGFFDEAIRVKNEKIPDDNAKCIAGVIKELQKKQGFDSILMLATPFGRMLAPRLAMCLGVGLVADVTQINRHEDSVEMVRPAFDGKILAGIVNAGKGPVMMSVRPGVFLCEKDGDRETVQISFEPENIRETGMKRLERKKKPAVKDIRESEVLIAGGGGILGDFDAIDLLARQLGGMKAASRKVVDSGKADRNIQVGQSGKTVHPDLYIALGIYGSLQHVAGLNRVRHLIAVNTNKNAPICSLADIVVEGDAREFVEKLTKKINQER